MKKMNPISIIVQSLTECNKAIYEIEKNTYEVINLRAKIFDQNGNLIDYDFRVSEELATRENLLDKATFSRKYYVQTSPFKLEGDFQYSPFNKKTRITITQISSISLDKQTEKK